MFLKANIKNLIQISCLRLPAFRSQAAILSVKSTGFTLHIENTKIGQGQPRVTIWTNYDGLESQMLHTKFHRNQSTRSGEDFEGFLPYMGVEAYLQNLVKNSPEEKVIIFICKCHGTKVKKWPWPFISSLAQLVVCNYQLSGHSLQLFLKTPLFSMFPIEKPKLPNLTLP